MRSLTKSVVLGMLLVAGSLAQAQQPADSSASSGASKEEVNELKKEVAEQRKTIEELKAVVQKLAESKTTQVADSDAIQTNLPAGEGVHLLNATLVEQAKPAQAPPADKQGAAKKPDAVPVNAGWNGEHFFIRSNDGQFQLMPYGYFQTDYRGYKGDGTPADTFVIRRARFGFQGNYGKYYDFAVLLDSAAGNGLSLRDLYVNVKPIPEFQVQAGQFKVPFNQETLLGASNLDFIERSLSSLIYPSASTAYRSPGITLHGDISGGVMQWWLGGFNGKGILQSDTTNEPEIVGRLRFYPWRKKKGNFFQGFAIGGSIDRGRSRGLSVEQSFNATEPDNAFNFFPLFRINGSIWRYNGEFTWVHGPWGLRGEYDQMLQERTGVGSEQVGGLGFTTLPGIVAKTGYGSVTYLLTGETKPENGTPKVKHPLFGPNTDASGGKRGLGAWELGFRYSRIQAREPGDNQLSNPFTPGFITTFSEHTDQFTGGITWYMNYWVKYQFNLDVDRLSSPSVTGQIPQNFYVLLNRMQFRF